MDFIRNLFGGNQDAPDSLLNNCKNSSEKQQLIKEAEQLNQELVKIGRSDDYLSEMPGGAYTTDCRHRRGREIGTRLYEIGGIPFMERAIKQVKRQHGASLATHLSYAWKDIGGWCP
jgi:hypothetical protein